MHVKGNGNCVNSRPESERVSALAWMAENEEIFGKQRSEFEVWEELRKDPELNQKFEQWNELWKKEFIAFCMGVQGMSLTYDPIFKKICSPEEHPERLKEFLSLCLGRDLEIVQVLPNESSRLTEENSLLVMDILVRLDTGELVNVEIQRIGYLFPGERCACYSSDLVMRQYVQIKGQKGKRFSYKDIRNVYTIVLIQKSSAEFHKLSDQYLHYGKQVFNTGLKLNMIQEYILIPLDIFRQNNQNISNRLDGWLQLLSSDSPEDIRRLLEVYPDFAELYREVFQFRYQMKELVSMFSEALSILDSHTVLYMVEQQQEEIKKQKEELEQKDAALEQKDAALEQMGAVLEQRDAALEQKDAEIAQWKMLLQAAQEENARLKAL